MTDMKDTDEYFERELSRVEHWDRLNVGYAAAIAEQRARQADEDAKLAQEQYDAWLSEAFGE